MGTTGPERAAIEEQAPVNARPCTSITKTPGHSPPSLITPGSNANEMAAIAVADSVAGSNPSSVISAPRHIY